MGSVGLQGAIEGKRHGLLLTRPWSATVEIVKGSILQHGKQSTCANMDPNTDVVM